MAKLTGWRRIASAMWREPNDPQIYGELEFDATSMLALMDRARAAGHRVTPTTIVSRAVAHSLHTVPDMNVRIRKGKVMPRETVSVFVITAVAGGRELSGVKIDRADEKSALEVADELFERATRMKTGDDPDWTKTKKTIAGMPHRLLRPSMRLTTWLAADQDMDVRALGLKRTPFGSAMVTSIGMFGIPHGFAPLATFYRLPLLVLVGEITPKPVAIDGRVEVRPVLGVTATIDHRYADGWHISELIKPFKAYMEDPAAFEPWAAGLPEVHAAPRLLA